ncbi:MAG: LysR family transcriptional regulator [Methyloceanibacter sp.]|nr:LysR family transcriptional regulator [Methyloceanibacter sp.]
MLIEFRLWRSFVVLAEELNFRRAADRLGLSQPALTKQIKELEDRLGVVLFRREPRGVERTDAAEANLKAARALIASAERLEHAFRTAETSAAEHVSLGALSYVTQRLLPRALVAARQTRPTLQTKVFDMTPVEAVGAAGEGRIDLGVALAPVREPNVVTRPLVEGCWMVVARRDQDLPSAPGLSDLNGEALVLFARRYNPDLYDDVVSKLAAQAPHATIAYHAQDPSAGLEMASHGLGMLIAASYALPPLPETLVGRPLDGLGGSLALKLVWRRDRMRPALRALIDGFTETSGKM